MVEHTFLISNVFEQTSELICLPMVSDYPTDTQVAEPVRGGREEEDMSGI